MSDDAPDKPAPQTKAEKLEAKAAQLREREAAKAQRAAAPTPAQSLTSKQLMPWVITVAVLVLALLGTIIYAVHEASSASDARKEASTSKHLDALRASVLKTATTVSASFGTYDYQTLDADFARTRAYLTPSFASDFSQLTKSLGTVISQAQGKTVGTVEGAAIQSLTPPTAVVLVFLDQKVTSSHSSTPTLDHNRLRLTMSLQANGKWLVSKLELI